MVVTEHHTDIHRGPKPLKPSYPGSRGPYGGRHPRRPYGRYPYRRHYYHQPIYVVQEPTTTVSHWWYPSTWYHSLFHEGFQNERNMNCGMLFVLCLIILVCLRKNK